MESLNSEFKAEIESRCMDVLSGVKYNFFELLHQPYGFDALQSWFCTQGGSEIDEYGLYKILKVACQNMSETHAWEIFDTFSQDLNITFKEFLMIIYLFAAAESGQLKLFLYLHGKKVYQLIAGGDRNDINFEKLKRLGRVLKINENYLCEKGKDISVNYLKSIINFEHFEVFYFKIFADLDKQRPCIEVEVKEVVKVQQVNEPERHVEVVSRPLKPVIHKKKTGCAGCNSKACNLL